MLIRTGGSVVLPGAVARPAEAGRLGARPWEATGSIAIDALLVWAIRDQRAADQRSGLFEAEAAAGAALAGQAGFHWDRASSDGCAAVERIGAAGCRIDVSGGGGSGRVSAVADAVYAAVMASPLAVELLQLARWGIEPDGWQAPVAWAVPRLGWVVEGETAVSVYEGPAKMAKARRAENVTPVIVLDREVIGAARARWVAWWDALDDVAWRLSALNLGFAVTGPGVAREPWQAGLDGAAII